MKYSVSERNFFILLEEKLGGNFHKALALFHDYGEKFSFDIANVLLHAFDKGKVETVLEIIENHLKKTSLTSIEETNMMFLQICEKTLRLKKAYLPQ